MSPYSLSFELIESGRNRYVVRGVIRDASNTICNLYECTARSVRQAKARIMLLCIGPNGVENW